MQNQDHHLSQALAFQDYYPEPLAHCYGCGRLNEDGLHIQSYWDPEDPSATIATVMPRPYHTAIPGYVYGGLLASLIDCHGTGTASAATYRLAGREMGSEPPLRFLTASLHVDYLKPTPLGVPLKLRGHASEVTRRKVVVDIELSANDVVTVRGQVVAVLAPQTLIEHLLAERGEPPGQSPEDALPTEPMNGDDHA